MRKMEIRYYRNYERHGQLAPEKVLENELEGYKEYKEKVRYKLIPHIW